MRVATRYAAGAVLPLMLLALPACQAFLPERATTPEGELPERFSVEAEQGVDCNDWWEDFNSAELTDLLDAALAGNLTLRQFWARLDQANSIVVQAGAGLYPQLDYESNASYRRTVTVLESNRVSFRRRLRDAALTGLSRGLQNAVQQATGTGGTGGTTGTSSGSLGTTGATAEQPSRLVTETKLFSLALAAGYELDLWGRIASQQRGAEFDAVATRDELESAAITLAAEVADRWLRIIEQQALRELLEEQLETNRTYLELVELRFRKGLVSALDVYQQRQVVQEVERQLPLIHLAAEVLRHDLAVLLGRPPTTELSVGSYDLSDVPDLPAVGVPAELLMRRPDVRAALARLYASDYRVASARADLLPRIRLTGGIGYSTAEIAQFFDDWFVQLAAGVTGPLFDGFQRFAEIERTLAVVEEALADYRLTVLIAIREVEDALVQERRQRESIEALVRQLDTASAALREASQRYQKGLNDYLPVLSALERTQALARGLLSARRELLVYRIGLYRALGGTWTHELEAPARLSEEAIAATETVEDVTP